MDCWRFYPDSGKALVSWSRKCGGSAELLESYIQKGGEWQDFVGVFVKDAAQAALFPQRILDAKQDYENGQRLGSEEILKPCGPSQNEKKLAVIAQLAQEQIILN